MIRIFIAVVGIMLFANVCSAEENPELESKSDKMYYTLGYQIGLDVQHRDVDIDKEKFLQGMQAALAGEESALNPEEMSTALTDLQMKMAAASQQVNQKVAEENLAAGQAFLAENAKKEGVTTLPDGLQYQVIKEGTGPKPSASDNVTVHYKGSLIDGQMFDSSYQRGAPASFAVNGVIKGWTEALQLMKTGAQWKLFIPAELAYGERNMGPIPPNSTLIFEVELISID